MKAKFKLWDEPTRRIYRRLLGYLRPYRALGLLSILAMVVDGGALAVFTNELKPLFNNIFRDHDPYYIFWMPIWILVIFGVRGVATFVSSYGISYIGRQVVQSIRRDVFGAYLRLPAAFYGAEPSGQQISRITYTSEQVASASSDAIKIAFTETATVIGMLAVMLHNSAYLTLALLVMVPAVALVVTVVSRRYRQISRRVQGMIGEVTGTVEEVVDAHREVRIYGGQPYERDRFERVTRRALQQNLKIAVTAATSSTAIQAVGAIALTLLVWLGTRPRVIDHIDAGVFIAVLMAMAGMLPSLKRLTQVQGNIQSGVSAAEDLFGVIDRPPERDGGTCALDRARGEIRFRGVELVYPRSPLPALRGIDLYCPPGRVTAVVGRSGSGKTSLANLLPRFVEPTAGDIELDGRPYREYQLAALRRQIAWVGQDVVLFDGTVAQNIAYGELAGTSEDKIVAAAEAANAMGFIRALPQGLHTPIGQRGNALSGGERQRLAIARAILKDAPILILDEATSALDTESERLIQQALDGLMKDRTTLVIAHRLSTIEHADLIAVMEQGRIVEQGRHAELLARNGRYATLYRMQFHDQAPD